jgi:Stage II sporulation protein E (SpoIIE)
MKKTPKPTPRFDPWLETPRTSVVVLLLSVFFFFTTIGFANDIIALGSEQTTRFVLGVVLSGGFAILYAVAGISLRGKWWKAVIPICAVQFVVMGLLAKRFPDLPQRIPMGAAAVEHMRARLILDSVATMAAINLGYAGFFFVSVREARRYVKTRTEKALLESEMAAARQVQQVILPDPTQSVPGFVIESVYKPAREVGGDFFQILPMGTRGLLFVIGDVSGKGLPAAMLVSLVIGSLRAIAEEIHDPVVLLRKLHCVITGHTPEGFVTALAAFIEDNGLATIANAGHLSPYLDGQEIQLPGGLPLGVCGAGRYEDTRLELQAGSRLTFLSDGVVEAQKANGELFGFDRAKSMSRGSAAAIAEAAVQFGQADDITVVTIERDPDLTASG